MNDCPAPRLPHPAHSGDSLPHSMQAPAVKRQPLPFKTKRGMFCHFKGQGRVSSESSLTLVAGGLGLGAGAIPAPSAPTPDLPSKYELPPGLRARRWVEPYMISPPGAVTG